MKNISVIMLFLVLAITISGCTDLKDSQVLDKAKDFASDVKDTLNESANDLIGDVTDKLNDTATNEQQEQPGETIKIASWNIENFGKSK